MFNIELGIVKVRRKEHNHTHTSLNEERNGDRIISCNNAITLEIKPKGGHVRTI